MNGNTRHTHKQSAKNRRTSLSYRRRRRQTMATVLTVVLVMLLLLLAVALIVGAVLHQKTADRRENSSTSDTEAIVPSTPKTPTVLAFPLDRESPSRSITSLAKDEKKAASLALCNENGDRLYGASTLSSIAKKADDAGLYLSGVLSLSALSQEDDLALHRALSEHCTLVAEALRAGLDEVLLVAPTLSEEQLPALVDFVADVRRLVPDAVIGLSLPYDFMTEDNATRVDTLAKSFSFLSVNATEHGKAEPTDYVSEVVDGTLYYLLRYSMRVLLPTPAEDEAQTAMIDTVKEYGVKNMQFLP